MSLKITSGDLLSRCSIEIHSNGITYFESAAFSTKRNFRFDQIETILLAADNTLSFQIGQELFSIRVRPDLPRQREIIDTFLRAVGGASPGCQVNAFPSGTNPKPPERIDFKSAY